MNIVAYRDEVYLFGGVYGSEYNDVSKKVLKVNLRTKKVSTMREMPFAQFDFKTVRNDSKIYCIGGCKNFFDMSLRPENACYDIIQDEWTMMPTIQFPGVYDNHYQTLSLAFSNTKLIAFWMQEQPQFAFAILDTNQPLKDSQWSLVYLKNPYDYSNQDDYLEKLTNHQSISISENKILIFGGFRGIDEFYQSKFTLVDLKQQKIQDLSTFKESQQSLIHSDMFYQNQVSYNTRWPNKICMYGKEHVHYFDIGGMVPEAVGIIKDDGDFPEAEEQ